MIGDNSLNPQSIAVFLGEHADKVIVLMQSGFFEMANGSMSFHFDATGKVRKIERHIVTNIS